VRGQKLEKRIEERTKEESEKVRDRRPEVGGRKIRK
jgi:hypothetical protein